MKREFSYKMVYAGLIGILIILGIMFMVSCQKEPESHLDLIQRTVPEFTQAEYETAIASAATMYDANDLLGLLGQYGTVTPDAIPAFNNYYQDITGGGSNLGQLSKVNGELFITNTGVLITDTTGYTFDWYINDVLQCTEANPKLWDLDDNLSCDGVVEMRLDITTPQGAKYSRTQWAYIDYNYIANCNCPECPSLFEVFYTFYPDVVPYFYQTQCATWDLDCNQMVDSNDLLTLLGGYGG